MAKVHRFEFDGYRVGDRLLDGVSFAVLVEIDGQSATIHSVEPWSEEDAAYLKRLNFEHFAEEARRAVQEDIDSFLIHYEENGGSFEEHMAEFEAETGLPGIQVLAEA